MFKDGKGLSDSFINRIRDYTKDYLEKEVKNGYGSFYE